MNGLEKYEGFMFSHVRCKNGVLYKVEDVDKMLERHKQLLQELKEDNINLSRAYDETLDLYRKQGIKDSKTIYNIATGFLVSVLLLAAATITLIFNWIN